MVRKVQNSSPYWGNSEVTQALEVIDFESLVFLCLRIFQDCLHFRQNVTLTGSISYVAQNAGVPLAGPSERCDGPTEAPQEWCHPVIGHQLAGARAFPRPDWFGKKTQS